jgi:hypothetical protein
MSIRARLLVSTVVAGICFPPLPLLAADMVTKEAFPIFAPAVDGVNARFDGFGGSFAHQSFYGGRSSVAMPLAGQWGAQVDVIGGRMGGDSFGSLGGHLFWRDPSRGLLGLYVNHTLWSGLGGVYVTQVAPEVEVYWNRWTFQGIAGVEFGNSGSYATSTSILPPVGPIPGVATTYFDTFDVKTRFFDQINLKYYFTDNWAGYVGHRYLGGKNALALGSEYAMPLKPGVMGSAFVEARLGSGSFEGLWGGLRLYIGKKDKSMMARHREDDPITWDTLFSIINSTHRNSGSSSREFCDGGGSPVQGSCEVPE